MIHARKICIALCMLPLLAFTPSDERSHRMFSDPSITIHWFDIEASSLTDVAEWFHSNGPKDPYGKKRFAVTRWTVRWKWPPDVDGTYDFRRTTSAADVAMHLPRWKPAGFTSTAEELKWLSVYRALISHEYDHARHAVNTASVLQSTIRRLGKRPDFKLQEAQKVARRLIRRGNEWDASYDRETQHGRNQGVSLL